MSLTSDIAALVTAVNTLIATYDGKKGQIDNAIAAAIAAVPLPARVFYVDQVNGNDNNDGTSPATCLQSIQKALSLAGAGRAVDIRLMRDHTLTSPTIAMLPGQQVRISSHLSVLGSVKYKLYLGLHANTASVPGDWRVGCFYAPAYGCTTLNLNSIEVVFPPAPGSGVMVSDIYNALLAGNIDEGPALMGLEMNVCVVTRPAGSVGVVLGGGIHFTSLFVKSTTFVTADLAGRWVAGVSSGTTPASTGRIISNLATL